MLAPPAAASMPPASVLPVATDQAKLTGAVAGMLRTTGTVARTAVPAALGCMTRTSPSDSSGADAPRLGGAVAVSTPEKLPRAATIAQTDRAFSLTIPPPGRWIPRPRSPYASELCRTGALSVDGRWRPAENLQNVLVSTGAPQMRDHAGDPGTGSVMPASVNARHCPTRVRAGLIHLPCLPCSFEA